jgi:glycosyltransferase involved in cell wall biosynthesis
MKIVYLASGAAGSFCGMCLHDNTLAAAMLKAGEDVMLVPTYTPLRTDEENVSAQPPMMFGGINVYLQQKSALFRHTPWFLDRLLDNPTLIRLATKFAPSVDAAKLGPMTVGMLQGEGGPLRKELDKLTAFLKHERPDVVHLSNTMLLGMAKSIREAVDVPLVCSLSGEDVFLEKLVPPYYAEARQLLRERSGDVDAFTSLNAYFADYMVEYMDLDRRRVHVIPHGLNLEGHSLRPPRTPGTPFTIGYFAHVCPEKGLHLLVDAFRQLCERPGLPPLRLVAAGYLSKGDRPFLDHLRAQLQTWGLADRFEYLGEPDRARKIAILQSFDVMSVPAVYRESKGLSILEALANGVPVVQPAHGSYPEMVNDTGGGLLCEPENPTDLADKLETYVRNPQLADEHGRRGHEAVRDRYTDRRMAEATIGLYRNLVDQRAAASIGRTTLKLSDQTLI